MAAATTYAANAILNALFGKTSAFGTLSTRPTLYVALSTTLPADDGSNFNEPAAVEYARVATAPADWADASAKRVVNANAISFAESESLWGTIFAVALMDAATGGNMIARGQILPASVVQISETRSFSPGDLVMELA